MADLEALKLDNARLPPLLLANPRHRGRVGASGMRGEDHE